MTEFQISVDEGPEQPLRVETGIYRDAVAAVPAILGLRLPITVKIWSADLVLEYGPYWYRVEEDRYGRLRTQSLIPTPA